MQKNRVAGRGQEKLSDNKLSYNNEENQLNVSSDCKGIQDLPAKGSIWAGGLIIALER